MHGEKEGAKEDLRRFKEKDDDKGRIEYSERQKGI
jgi:hypothetical protein